MNEEIIFLDEDTPTTIAIKTVGLYAGSNELKTKLSKLGITYTKVYKGLNTYYCLKGKGLDGTLRIKL